jgi:hypothetical protein
LRFAKGVNFSKSRAFRGADHAAAAAPACGFHNSRRIKCLWRVNIAKLVRHPLATLPTNIAKLVRHPLATLPTNIAKPIGIFWQPCPPIPDRGLYRDDLSPRTVIS